MIDIRTLRAAGLTETQILRVVEEDQAKRREQNRKAQQKHRAGQHDIADRADTVLPSLLDQPLTVVQERKVEIVALGREFAEFYAAYPHKVGKRAAATAFERARRRVPMAEIMAGLARYASKTDDRPWCNPATWLNQDRCHDQPGPAQEGNGNGRGRAPKDDPKSIRGAFDRLAERWGPGWEDEARELSRQAHLRLVPGGSGG